MEATYVSKTAPATRDYSPVSGALRMLLADALATYEGSLCSPLPDMETERGPRAYPSSTSSRTRSSTRAPSHAATCSLARSVVASRPGSVECPKCAPAEANFL